MITLWIPNWIIRWVNGYINIFNEESIICKHFSMNYLTCVEHLYDIFRATKICFVFSKKGSSNALSPVSFIVYYNVIITLTCPEKALMVSTYKLTLRVWVQPNFFLLLWISLFIDCLISCLLNENINNLN